MDKEFFNELLVGAELIVADKLLKEYNTKFRIRVNYIKGIGDVQYTLNEFGFTIVLKLNYNNEIIEIHDVIY